MKKSIIPVLFVTTFLVAVFIASCSTPAPAVNVQPSPAPTSEESARINTTPLFTNDPTYDQAILTNLAQAVQGMINTYRLMNQPVPEKILAAQKAVNEANDVLRELDNERQPILLMMNQYKFMDEPIPNSLTVALQRIEDQRQVILIRCGLVD
jgi:hypothetical protein